MDENKDMIPELTLDPTGAAAQAADRGQDDERSPALPLEAAAGPVDNGRPPQHVGADGWFLE